MFKIALRLLFVILFVLASALYKQLNKHDNAVSSDIEEFKSIHSKELVEAYKIKLEEILEKYDFRGNIVLVLHGESIFKASYGQRNYTEDLPNDEHSVFQLASVSKQFTAMGIALLEHEGKLNYDDLVKQHMPEFVYDKITVKHLLVHTSGLPNYVWFLENEWTDSTFPTNESLNTFFKRLKPPLNFKQGKYFTYSNTGYAFLALLIERVSGKSYAEFLKEKIFDVLGMQHTFVFDKALLDTMPNLSLGYESRNNKMYPYGFTATDGIVGDKGIFSCINDLLKWDEALYKNTLMPQEKINTLFEKNLTTKGDTVYYGLGWRIPRVSVPQMVYHNGWWHGYRCTLRRYVGDKNTLIILNNTTQSLKNIIREIEEFMYPEILPDTTSIIE